MDEETFYDLTQIIDEDIPLFKGDPPFKCELFYSISKGFAYNLCCLQLGNHTGTHVDYPKHVDDDGKTSSAYPLKHFHGLGAVFELPQTETSVKKKHITENSNFFKKDHIVFFKTKNSTVDRKKLLDEAVYIEPEAAAELVKNGVKIVGIDGLSVDSLSNEDLTTHKILLRNNVLIVEFLKLDEIPQGEYYISINPLRLRGTDGAPAIVSATK